MITDMSSPYRLPNGDPKTVIVTGGASGIGAQTIRTYASHGCNVVIADLPSSSSAANAVISSLPDPSRALYQPANIVNWEEMKALFRETKSKFGQVDIVVANAGLMESKGFFDFEEDDQGELKEPSEAWRVIDVNLKGTMNSMSYLPSFSLLTTFILMVFSPPVSNALDEIKRSRRGWCTRFDSAHCFNFGLLRWHRSSIIHLIQAWRCRTRACIAKSRE